MRGDATITSWVEAWGVAVYFTRHRTFPRHKKLSALSISSAEVEKTLVRGVFFNQSHLERVCKIVGMELIESQGSPGSQKPWKEIKD